MITKIHSAINTTVQNIKNYSLTFSLKDQVLKLEHQKQFVDKEIQRLQRQTDLLNKKNEGLIKIEKFLKSVSSDKNTDSTVKALTSELQRLMKVVETQSEVIEKEPYTNSQISSLIEPEMVKSSNPVSFIKNFIRFKNQMGEYEQKLLNNDVHNFYLSVSDDLKITSLSSTAYKSEYLKEQSTYVEVGGKLRRYYYLADIPAYLSPYIFFKLLNSSIPFSLSIFMEPASSSELLKKARQRLSVLEMQQNERLKNGKLRDQQLDKNIDEVTSFIDELIHEVEKGVIYSLYLQIEADTEAKLTKIHKQLQNLGSSMDLIFNQYTFGHQQALKNFLPFSTDHIQENRVLQSTAASYLMPFVSKQLNDPDGIFMGVNGYNDSLVFINPFTSRNNNINIFGVSGSGKSVTSKILINRLHMRGIQNIIIDPEGEYVEFAKALGGEVIQFSRDKGINPFYVASSKENDILDHISTLKTFFKFFIPPHHFEGAVLDEKLIELYDQGTPNFENLLKLLGKHEMANDLKVLSTGSLRGIFNSERSLELNNDIIVLDLHDLKKDEKREPAMYLLTSLIWNLTNNNNDQRRMLFIDEAHKLLVEPEVAIFYRELVKQARKRKVGVVSITQDVEDFLHSEYGKAIITNSETKILLKQSYAALVEIGTIYPMTDEEKQQLGHLDIGEVILFRENEHVRLQMLVLPFEQSIVMGG